VVSFVRPEWLLLELLALPILAMHLRRRRRVVVPSILIWSRVLGVPATRASRRVPVPTVLLLLQLLALTLLVLGLARPTFGGSVPDHWIVVVDASGSMQASDVPPSRIAAARSYLESGLRRHLVGSGRRERVSIVAMGAVPEVLGARLTSLDAARRAAAALEPTAADPDWARLGSVLPGLVRRGERTAVTILTDPSDAKAATAAVASALGDASVRSVSFAGAHPSNLGLASVSVAPTASGTWRIAGTVRRYAGSLDRTQVDVLFGTGGRDSMLPWTTLDANLGTDGTATFQTELKLPAPGTLELRLPADDLASDNGADYLLRAGPLQIKVLEVGPGDAPLERALTSIDGVKVYRAASLPASVSDYALVVVDGVHVDRRPATATWWLDAPPPGVAFGAAVSVPTASAWLPGHPLSRTVDWTALHVTRADVAPRLPGADVLLQAGGHPLVQARTTPQGREVLTTFALKDSDWPTLTSFPAFVYDLVRWVAPDLGRAVATPCRAGQACPLDPGLAGPSAQLYGPTGAAILLADPWVSPQASSGATSEAWLATGLAPLFRPRQPGLYTVEDGTARRTVAVNAWGSSFSALQPKGAGAAPGARRLPATWKVLLTAALLALLVEAWLAAGAPLGLRSRGPGRTVRWREVWAWRLAAAALLVLALVDPPLPWPQHDHQAVLVSDQPSLLPAQASSTLRSFRSAAAGSAGANTRLGVVSLGSEPAVEADLGSRWRPTASRPTAAWPGSDLGDALRTALGMLPRGRGGRVVVAASDAAAGGDLGDALAEARARRIPIDVLPVAAGRAGDASVEAVRTPPDVYPKGPFTVHGIVRSATQQAATVRILQDGVLKEQRSVQLAPGSNDVRAKLTVDTSGRHTVTMEVKAANDTFAANDRNTAVVDVRPEPRVALVTETPARAKVLVAALAEQGVKADVVSPTNAPWDVKGWLAYDAAILMDVPAIDLHSTQQAQLETWVRDDGGGLLILGGANSFGPGGYFNTPIERMSPLSSKIPRQAPQVALLFVLDRSGSMQQQVGGMSRLAIAKSATVDAVKLLNPASLTGVVVFDTRATPVVPLQKVSALSDLSSRLAAVQAAGGTSLYPALVEALHELQGVDSMTKHVVVMSDGLSQPADFEGIISQMRAAGITVSAVSISEEADKSFLQHIAALGKGAFHAATDVKALPSILAQEALLLSANPVKTESIQPIWGDRKASFLDGLPDALPPLGGYVQTSVKPQANVALAGADGTPLLASWRYGVGRVIAFASQVAGPWTAAWLNDPLYAKLWSQAVRWTLSKAPRPGLNVRLTRQGDEGRVEVQAVAPNGGPASGVHLVAAVTGPDGREQAVTLREAARGSYEGGFAIDGAGSYRVQVGPTGGATGPATWAPASGQLVAAYPARYAQGADQPGLLEAIASATGGRVLTGSEPLVPGRSGWRLTSRFLPDLWLLLALGVFLVELAARYLSLRTWWAVLRRGRAARGRHPGTARGV
jgi:uncharacterized membrane protein